MDDRSLHMRPLAKWVRHGRLRLEDPAGLDRLDAYLGKRFPYRSRTQWVRIIESGRVLVNGERARPSRRLRLGDQIDYVPERQVEPEVERGLHILWEDDALLAVDKPANLPVHPSGRYFRNTLLCILLESRGETLDQPGIRIVHRLDRETSGVVLFGKARLHTSQLAGQFERRSVAKEYLLLVHGVPTERHFVIDAPLGRNPESRVRKAVGVVPGGVPARTEFDVVGAGRGHALLRARPVTGRLHQIRVHARHAGFPVVGDKLYGGDEGLFLKLAEGREYDRGDRERLLLDRQCLHARRLTLRHPLLGTRVTFTASLPEEIASLAVRLGVPPDAVANITASSEPVLWESAEPGPP